MRGAKVIKLLFRTWVRVIRPPGGGGGKIGGRAVLSCLPAAKGGLLLNNGHSIVLFRSVRNSLVLKGKNYMHLKKSLRGKESGEYVCGAVGRAILLSWGGGGGKGGGSGRGLINIKPG